MLFFVTITFRRTGKGIISDTHEINVIQQTEIIQKKRSLQADCR